jgi:FG-GAP-like repeat
VKRISLKQSNRIYVLLAVCVLGAFALASGVRNANVFAFVAAAPPVQAAACQNPSLQFNNQISLQGSVQHYFTTGDFNGDGKQDLVVQTTGGALQIGFGDGTGHFNFNVDNATHFAGGIQVLQMGSGDFNGDGKIDLITLEAGANNQNLIQIYPIVGTGSFGNRISIVTRASSFQVGDFNKDGKSDIAATLKCCPEGVAVYLSNANGTFTATTNTWGASRVSAVADFNGDGNADILTSDNYYPSHQVRLGNGSGQFTNGDYLFYGVNVNFFATTDFNKDGKADLLGSTGQNRSGVDEANSRKLIVLTNTGAGHFTASYPSVPLDAIPFDSIAADFNGDGYPDIANRSTNIFSNNGSGGLCPSFSLTTAYSNKVGAADFNGDGKADLIRQVNGDKLEIWTSGGSTPTNTPPTIVAAAPISLPTGTAGSIIYDVATVADAQTPAGNLTVATTSVPVGITVTSLTNTNGQIRAIFTVDCATVLGQKLLELTVTDANGATAKTNLAVTVNNPLPNLPGVPTTLNIPVGLGAEFGIADSTATGPAFTVSSSFTGVANYFGSGVSATFRISNAGPVGVHTVTFNFKERCGRVTPIIVTINVTGETQACKFPVFRKESISYSNVIDIASADFNLDGKKDLVLFGPHNLIDIKTRNGAGGIVTIASSQILDSSATGVKLADLDGDGDPDIIINSGLRTQAIFHKEGA